MNRRDFLLVTTAVSLAMPVMTHAATTYAPDLLKAELAAGKTVFLTFKASWCSTCAAQERVISALRQANPDYAARISFIDVDWDEWSGGDLVRELNIPRRSTLVVLRGDEELGRIVAGTGKAEIRALMDVALGAATA